MPPKMVKTRSCGLTRGNPEESANFSGDTDSNKRDLSKPPTSGNTQVKRKNSACGTSKRKRQNGDDSPEQKTASGFDESIGRPTMKKKAQEKLETPSQSTAEEVSKQNPSDGVIKGVEGKPKEKRKGVTRRVLGKNVNPEDIDLQVLGAHSKLVVAGGSNMKGVHQCLLCKLFSTAAAVNMYGHILMHLSGELSCSQCEYHARNTTELNEHIAASHKKETLYICSFCGERFYHQKRLRIHEASLHNKQPIYAKSQKRECDLCPEVFSSGPDLKKHIQQKHDSSGLFRCSTCKKTFLTQVWLDKHVDLYCAGWVLNQLQCNMCDARFPDARRMKLHQRQVHQKEKPHACSLCDFRSFSATSLKLHDRTHTGFHPFKCKECDFTAAKKFQLTSHLRTHTGEKLFSCDQCPYTGRWSVQLRKHSIAHQSLTCVVCPFCKIAFSHARQLIHHGRAHKDIQKNIFDMAIRDLVQPSLPVGVSYTSTGYMTAANSPPETEMLPLKLDKV